MLLFFSESSVTLSLQYVQSCSTLSLNLQTEVFWSDPGHCFLYAKDDLTSARRYEPFASGKLWPPQGIHELEITLYTSKHQMIQTHFIRYK